MLCQYRKFNGQAFPTPDSLFASPNMVKFIIQWGDQALDALADTEEEQLQQLIDEMIEGGLLERDEQTGALRLTPRMLRGIQHRALLEVFEGLKRGTREGHPTQAPGGSDERTDGTKPYEFGDPINELDLGTTMRNALRRHQAEQHQAGQVGSAKLPLAINSSDFELHRTEGQSDVAMCIVLDMSGSMMRWGRFYQAKRVALGMAGLRRSKFPQDTIDFVGFYSTACRISESQLPLVMPKPVTIHEHQVRLRVPLDQADQHPDKVPQHFTNLQLGLRLARQILSRRGAANKQIFVITDGQPTAHVETNQAGGEMLYLLYPPTERTSTITLTEALRCQQQGIEIATFALIEDYWGMDWVNFVDQMTRLTRGLAYYCTSEDLSSTVIESYLTGKKRKSFIS